MRRRLGTTEEHDFGVRVLVRDADERAEGPRVTLGGRDSTTHEHHRAGVLGPTPRHDVALLFTERAELADVHPRGDEPPGFDVDAVQPKDVPRLGLRRHRESTLVERRPHEPRFLGHAVRKAELLLEDAGVGGTSATVEETFTLQGAQRVAGPEKRHTALARSGLRHDPAVHVVTVKEGGGDALGCIQLRVREHLLPLALHELDEVGGDLREVDVDLFLRHELERPTAKADDVGVLAELLQLRQDRIEPADDEEGGVAELAQGLGQLDDVDRLATRVRATGGADARRVQTHVEVPVGANQVNRVAHVVSPGDLSIALSKLFSDLEKALHRNDEAFRPQAMLVLLHEDGVPPPMGEAAVVDTVITSSVNRRQQLGPRAAHNHSGESLVDRGALEDHGGIIARIPSDQAGRKVEPREQVGHRVRLVRREYIEAVPLARATVVDVLAPDATECRKRRCQLVEDGFGLLRGVCHVPQAQLEPLAALCGCASLPHCLPTGVLAVERSEMLLEVGCHGVADKAAFTHESLPLEIGYIGRVFTCRFQQIDFRTDGRSQCMEGRQLALSDALTHRREAGTSHRAEQDVVFAKQLRELPRCGVAVRPVEGVVDVCEHSPAGSDIIVRRHVSLGERCCFDLMNLSMESAREHRGPQSKKNIMYYKKNQVCTVQNLSKISLLKHC